MNHQLSDKELESLIMSDPYGLLIPYEDKTYDCVIGLIRRNLNYYKQFVDTASGEFATGSVEALNEILDNFKEPYENTK